MSALLFIAGLFIVALSMVDALWTTLWVDGGGGPLNRRYTSWLRRLIWSMTGRGNHHRLSITGPAVLVASVVTWTLSLWLGWVLLFSAAETALLDSHTDAPARLADRIYFIGYALSTMGNGDYTPSGDLWEVLTAIATLSGIFVMTLVVTYLMSVLQSVTTKRSFANQVLAVARSGEEFVVRSWHRDSFPSLDSQLLGLAAQLGMVTAGHEAYPMLYYYHAARAEQSVARAIMVLDDALTLIEHGVQADVRPAPAVLRTAREAVGLFLDAVSGAYIEPAEEPCPPPELSRVRAAGVPVTGDEEFARAVDALRERRRLVHGLLASERREPGRQ